MEQEAKRPRFESVYTYCLPVLLSMLNASDLITCSEVCEDWNRIIHQNLTEWLTNLVLQHDLQRNSFNFRPFPYDLAQLYELYRRKWISSDRYIQLRQSLFDDTTLAQQGLSYYLVPTLKESQESFRFLFQTKSVQYGAIKLWQRVSPEAFSDFYLNSTESRIPLQTLVNVRASFQLLLKLYTNGNLMSGQINWTSIVSKRFNLPSFGVGEYIKFLTELSKIDKVVVKILEYGGSLEIKIVWQVVNTYSVLLHFVDKSISQNVRLWQEIIHPLMKFPEFQNYFRKNYHGGLKDSTLELFCNGLEDSLPYSRNDWATSDQLRNVFARMRSKKLKSS